MATVFVTDQYVLYHRNSFCFATLNSKQESFQHYFGISFMSLDTNVNLIKLSVLEIDFKSLLPKKMTSISNYNHLAEIDCVVLKI